MILVTGGAGYIGSHVVLSLHEMGYEVVVLDDLSRGHEDLIFSPNFVECDIRDREAVDKAFTRFPVEAVLHFAARSLVGESMREPEAYYDVNVNGTLSLLSVMRDRGVNALVFSSSAAVYGEPKRTPISEEDELRPTNVYGETKLFIESMLRRYHEAYGLNSVSLRYFNAAGADPEGRSGEDHDPETHLIPLVLDVALGRRKEITIFGTDYPTPDGSCIRDYIHVTDLASAHVLALKSLTQGEARCSAYNLGNGMGYSVKEVIDVARRVTGKAIPASAGPRRPGDPAVLVASSDRAQKNLGWRRAHPKLEEIVATAWEWHRRRFSR